MIEPVEIPLPGLEIDPPGLDKLDHRDPPGLDKLDHRDCPGLDKLDHREVFTETAPKV